MKKKIIKLSKKPFIKSVLIMLSGTLAAQIIKLILVPFITRIYGPDAIGIMGVFNTIIQIIIPVAALAYPIAIVLPKSDINAKNLMKLSINISVIIAFILSSILIIFNKQIVNLFNIEEVSNYLLLIPLVIVLTTFMQVLEQWYIRTKQFGVNAKSMFYQALIVESSKVGIGLFHPVASILVLLSTLNNGIRAMFLFLIGRNTSHEVRYDSDEPAISMKSLAKKYKDFPLLRAPQLFIDASSRGLPILMLTSLFNVASAGFYTISNMVLAIPSSFIGQAVGNVFYPRINEAAIKGEKLTYLIKKAVLALSFIGLIPFGLIFVFGPTLFSFVFGSSWVVAGEYARWLALSRFVRFSNEPCLKALPVLSAQSLHLKVTIGQTIARILALSIGFFVFNDDVIAVALYAISGVIINLLLIVITLNISKKFDKSRGEY